MLVMKARYEKALLTSSICPRAFQCDWEIRVNVSLWQDTAFAELPVTQAAQGHPRPPGAGSLLGLRVASSIYLGTA